MTPIMLPDHPPQDPTDTTPSADWRKRLVVPLGERNSQKTRQSRTLFPVSGGQTVAAGLMPVRSHQTKKISSASRLWGGYGEPWHTG